MAAGVSDSSADSSRTDALYDLVSAVATLDARRARASSRMSTVATSRQLEWIDLSWQEGSQPAALSGLLNDANREISALQYARGGRPMAMR